MPQPRKVEDNYQGPGQYLHYKGGEYHVLGLALQENTVIKPGETAREPNAGSESVFVIYSPLTSGSLLEQRREDFWAREWSDFNALVECTTFHDDDGNEYEEEGGYLVRRFVKLPDLDAKDLVFVTAQERVNHARVRITHKPTGLIGDAEGESRLWAQQNAVSRLRRAVAFHDARI